MSSPAAVARTILVADDDDALRGMMSEVLVQAGFRVLVARNALEALRICQASDRLDLVIVDVVMPLMDGLALAERLREKRPVPLLLISGDPGSFRRASARLLQGTAFLQKPFNLDELLKAVRSLVTASP